MKNIVIYIVIISFYFFLMILCLKLDIRFFFVIYIEYWLLDEINILRFVFFLI